MPPPPWHIHPRYREPTPDPVQQEYRAALEDFRRIRTACERNAVGNRRFVLVEPLTKLLTGDTHVLERLRDCANRCISSTSAPALLREHLNGYRTIFYILVEIGHPHLIPMFRDHGINDGRLPLREATLRSEITRLDCSTLSDNFYSQFLAEQYAWCPVTFNLDMGSYLHNRIVPFYRRVRIQPYRDDRRPPENNASLWEVDIPEELVHIDLRNTLEDEGASVTRTPDSEKRLGLNPDGNQGKRYHLALKQFPQDKKAAFEREKAAFQALAGQDGMIRYIGWYQSMEATTMNQEPTYQYNILLEYAEFDLYTVMRTEAPPVSPSEIRSFWEAMLDICRTLDAIHKIKIEGDDYDVWHGDVKPENILRVRDRFKLADPGEARIQRSNGEGSPRAVVIGGTMTYASPEKGAYLNGRTTRPPRIQQNSDVWSLGGVLSNAATYVVLGTQGVLLYDRVRRHAIEKATKMSGDAFHDGVVVLEEVKKWHMYLRSASRHTDGFTAAILAMIDQRMLVDVSQRCSAAGITAHLEKLLVDPNNVSLAREVPDTIEDILQDIDLDVESVQEKSIGVTTVSSDESRLKFNIDTTNVVFKSKHQLLNQQILPTAQRTLHRQNTNPNNPSALSLVGTAATTSTIQAKPTPSSLATTNLGATSHDGQASYEEFMSPYTMWNLMDDLESINKGRVLLPSLENRSRPSFVSLRSAFRKRHPSVRGRWNVDLDKLEQIFDGRDIVFLVDNGWTMRRHWREATYLLKALSWRALGYDDDGMELYFTNPDTTVSVTQSKQQSVDEFVQVMDQASPHEGQLAHKTNIVPQLSKIMNDYLLKKTSSEKEKPKTIIIFTDGIWKGMNDDDAVDELIKNNIKFLRDLHYDRDVSTAHGEPSSIATIRPVTIQFIRFGKDPVGAERLRRLDNDLELQGFEDMVDCEPSNGDVYKMFLGSLIKDMDMKQNITNYDLDTPRSQRTTASDLSFRARTSTVLSEESQLSQTSPLRSSIASYSTDHHYPDDDNDISGVDSNRQTAYRNLVGQVSPPPLPLPPLAHDQSFSSNSSRGIGGDPRDNGILHGWRHSDNTTPGSANESNPAQEYGLYGRNAFSDTSRYQQ